MLNTKDGDWVPIFRKIRKHWSWSDRPFSKGQAWVDLICRANYRESSFPFRGYPPIAIAPREMPATLKGLADDWGWSRERVDRFLLALEDESSVSRRYVSYESETRTWTGRRTDSGLMILTIVNLPLTGEEDSEPAGEPAPRPAGNRQGTRSGPAGDAHILRIQEEQQQQENKTVVPEAHARATLNGQAHVQIPDDPLDRPCYGLSLVLLLSGGVRRKTATEIAGDRTYREVWEAVEQGKSKRNPGGWIRHTLEQGLQLAPVMDAETAARLREEIAAHQEKPSGAVPAKAERRVVTDDDLRRAVHEKRKEHGIPPAGK